MDEYILLRFIDGEIEDVAMTGEDFNPLKTVKTVFYVDAAEAEARIQSYLAQPPQLQRFREGLSDRIVPLHAIDESDWEGAVHTLDCLPRGSPLGRAGVVEAV